MGTKALVCAALALSILASPAAATEERPNVILLIWDDPNLEHFGFLGNGAAHTPTMDLLATGGIRFTRGTTMPRCAPALAQLLSGKASIHPRNGVCWNGTPELLTPTKLLPQLLFCGDDLELCATAVPGDADHLTFGQGKVGWTDLDLFDDLRFTHGRHDPDFWRFTDRHCSEGQLSICAGGPGISLLPCQRNPTRTPEMIEFFGDVPMHSGPFFMWLVARLPHAPFDPPREYMDLVDCSQIPVPPSVDPSELNAFLDQEHKQLALTAWLDDRLGDLLFHPTKGLQANGFLENTWVVNVVGDNGYTAGKIHKGSPYRAGTGCWISFWRNDLPAGSILEPIEFDFPVDALDVPATILELAGKTQPDSWGGTSLASFLQPGADPSTMEGRTVYSAAFTGPVLTSVEEPAGSLLALHATTRFQGSTHHYVLWTLDVPDEPTAATYQIKHDFADFGSRAACQEELYDLGVDPGETTDLLAGTPSPAHVALAQTLRQGALDWWLATRGEPLVHPCAGQ